MTSNSDIARITGHAPVELLIILDGATDAVQPSALELARMPALAELGPLVWAPLLPDGVPVGSETAIAALLGWTPSGPVDRARVEAAARGLGVATDRVRRVDLPAAGARLLVFGDAVIEAAGPIREWPAGDLPPRILDSGTVVIGALGAATGLGALMGARIVVPAGATGGPDSDLGAKRRAALDAILAGDAARVVVHVGGPDEAAHRRDREAKIAVLERADRELIGPLAEAVRAVGGSLTVAVDHGTDPLTGEHVPGPVPQVTWTPALVPA